MGRTIGRSAALVLGILLVVGWIGAPQPKRPRTAVGLGAPVPPFELPGAVPKDATAAESQLRGEIRRRALALGEVEFPRHAAEAGLFPGAGEAVRQRKQDQKREAFVDAVEAKYLASQGLRPAPTPKR